MELLDTFGVSQLKLCSSCNPEFLRMMVYPIKEEVHVIPNLPGRMTSCGAAGLAAVIHRVIMWASTESYCDTCACQIGTWAYAILGVCKIILLVLLLFGLLLYRICLRDSTFW